MAVTVTGGPTAGGKTERVALDSSAGNATAITLPSWVRKCTVQFADSGGASAEGKVLRGQTQSDGAAMSAHAFPVASGAAYELTIAVGTSRHLGGATFYASGSASGFVYLDLEL